LPLSPKKFEKNLKEITEAVIMLYSGSMHQMCEGAAVCGLLKELR
jgi:hypothetical protein